MHRELEATEAALREARELAEGMGDPGLVEREMRETCALVEDAETWGRAVRAAAAYETRKASA